MNRIITLGREFGSGGRELGRRLSEKLGIAYYDQEIITEIAKRTALSVEYIHRIEDSVPVASFPIHIGRTFFSMPNPVFQQSINLFREQHKLISELAEKSDCLIVGRCAGLLLFHPPYHNGNQPDIRTITGYRQALQKINGNNRTTYKAKNKRNEKENCRDRPRKVAVLRLFQRPQMGSEGEL